MAQYFTDEQKRAAVDRYFECRNSTVVVEELGYPSVTALLEWAKLDSRWDRPVRKYKQRSHEEKLAVVADYLDGSCSVREIAERHKISPSQVSRWAKQYLRRGPEALRPKGKKGVPVNRRNDKVRPDPTPPPEQVPDEGLREYCEQLKFENDVLRAELDLFAKKAQASARKGSQTPRNRS